MRLFSGTVYLLGVACAISAQSDRGTSSGAASDPAQSTKSRALVGEVGSKNGSAGRTTETKQLRIYSSPGFVIVHAGQRIGLVLDIDLKPGMHVYATGAASYIPVEWKITKTAAFSPRQPLYPRAVKLYLKPIQETVPVYQSRFRVVQTIHLGTDDQVEPLLSREGDLLIGGDLHYQACDDRMCYIPQTASIQWTFHYEGGHGRHSPNSHLN